MQVQVLKAWVPTHATLSSTARRLARDSSEFKTANRNQVDDRYRVASGKSTSGSKIPFAIIETSVTRSPDGPVLPSRLHQSQSITHWDPSDSVVH